MVVDKVLDLFLKNPISSHLNYAFLGSGKQEKRWVFLQKSKNLIDKKMLKWVDKEVLQRALNESKIDLV